MENSLRNSPQPRSLYVHGWQHLRSTTVPVPEWLLGLKVYNDWIYVDDKKFALGTVGGFTSQKILVGAILVSMKISFPKLWNGLPEGVTTIDSRFALGSIQLHGPTALQSLAKVLHLELASAAVSDAWRWCSQVADSLNIPIGTVFCFLQKTPASEAPSKSTTKQQAREEIFFREPAFCGTFCPLFSFYCLRAALLHTTICTRWNNWAKEFANHDPSSTHIHGASKLPVLIYKMANGTWCVNMPWFWVQPVWSKLVQVKSIKTAGMRQEHQINFERGIATYPHDFPYLFEGYKEHFATWKRLRKLPAENFL